MSTIAVEKVELGDNVDTSKNFLIEVPAEIDRVNTEARKCLADTDWYVIRMQETGVPIPAEILAGREAARARVVS